MDWISRMNALGIFAAVCSTSASLPQLCSSSPQTLRLGSILLRGVGAVSWAAYGGLRHDYPLMGSSGIAAAVEFILWARRRRALTRLKTHGTAPPSTHSVNDSSPAVIEYTRGE